MSDRPSVGMVGAVRRILDGRYRMHFMRGAVQRSDYELAARFCKDGGDGG